MANDLRHKRKILKTLRRHRAYRACGWLLLQISPKSTTDHFRGLLLQVWRRQESDHSKRYQCGYVNDLFVLKLYDACFAANCHKKNHRPIPKASRNGFSVITLDGLELTTVDRIISRQFSKVFPTWNITHRYPFILAGVKRGSGESE